MRMNTIMSMYDDWERDHHTRASTLHDCLFSLSLVVLALIACASCGWLTVATGLR
jgi:hypothetical protein